jgi:hypothetical protein
LAERGNGEVIRVAEGSGEAARSGRGHMHPCDGFRLSDSFRFSAEERNGSGLEGRVAVERAA